MQTKIKYTENSINQNCSLFLNKKKKMSTNRFDDGFTVHVILSASMQIFESNNLASFLIFSMMKFNSGDWRVALSEIIFQTKFEHVVNGDLIAYSPNGYKDSQKILTVANVISRGEKLSFMTGNLVNVNQLLGSIKPRFGLPNFLFQEIKST